MTSKTFNILDAFILDNTNKAVDIVWENDEPLVHALDIGKVLEIANMHTLIDSNYFGPTDKVCIDEHTYLTERAIYELLMISRKPFAVAFHSWIKDIMTLIRKRGKYDLDFYDKDNVDPSEQLLKLLKYTSMDANNSDLDAKHNVWVKTYHKKPVVYFGIMKSDKCGMGDTETSPNTICIYKTSISSGLTLLNC
jgi:prophage antirepressor-like protein